MAETGNSHDSDTSTERMELIRSERARRHCYQVWMLIGALILMLAFGYAMGVLSVPVGIIIWTVVIVFCLRGPVNALEKRGIPRPLGTTLAYILMAVVLIALSIIMFSPVFGIGDQFADMLQQAPVYIDSLFTWLQNLYAEYEQFFQDDTVKEWLNSASQGLIDWVSNAARVSASGVVGLGVGVGNVLLIVGFALVVAFWILMDLPAIGRECRRLIGEKHREDADMLHITFTRVMGGYIKATLVQCLIIGIVCAVAFTVLGIPNAAAIGLITGVMNIIPVVGPWIGGALAAVVGLLSGPVVAVLAMLAVIVVQQFVYTFVSPKLMSDSVDVHPALVIIALLAGSAVGGAMQGLVGSLVGMLLSIPLVAVAKTVFIYYFEKKTGRQVVSEDGFLFKGTPSRTEDAGSSPDVMADAVGKCVERRGCPSSEEQPVVSFPDITKSVSNGDEEIADHAKKE